MNEHHLTGLDASNPLAFLAALGALTIANDVEGARPTLHFVNAGRWAPVLRSSETWPQFVERVAADPATWANAPALALTYPDGKGGLVRDLKAPLDHLGAWLDALAGAGKVADRSQLDLVAAFASDVVADQSGVAAKPTALHFTAGQQRFLEAAHEIRGATTLGDFTEALLGPWGYTRDAKVLGWDCTVARSWALRASDPSKDPKRGIPGADWLALRGLACFPVSPVVRRRSGELQLRTASTGGPWKVGGWFRWPLWTVPLDLATARSVLPLALSEGPGPRLVARGVGAVFQSGIVRSDQGGYGSFLPSQPATAADGD